MSKRERILEAAARLFAERSYDAVGIRDIAAEAGANSALISYHFGGKVGLLSEIFSVFSKLMVDCMRNSLEASKDQFDFFANVARNMVSMARQNRDIVLLGVKMRTLNCPDFAEMNEELYQNTLGEFYNHAERLGISATDDEAQSRMIFNAVMSLCFSDYLASGGHFIDNDLLVDKYVETITLIMSRGLAEFSD